MYLFGKKEDGSCVFLGGNNRCNVYEQRPLECKIYPFLLDFSEREINLKLDKRYCPSLETLTHDMDKVLKSIRQERLPIEWIKGYEYLEDGC